VRCKGGSETCWCAVLSDIRLPRVLLARVPGAVTRGGCAGLSRLLLVPLFPGTALVQPPVLPAARSACHWRQGACAAHQARSCNATRAEACAPCRAGVQCRASKTSRCSSRTIWCLLWLRYGPWAACVLPQRSLAAACRRSSCCCGGRCAAAPLRRATPASLPTMVRCGPRAVSGATALPPEGVRWKAGPANAVATSSVAIEDVCAGQGPR